MSAPSVLIAGCGDVGSRLATQLLSAGWEVHGLRRDVSRLPEGVIGVAGDLFNKDCPDTWPIGAVDYLVYCAAATDHDEAGYRAAYVQGLEHVLDWLNDYGQVPNRLLFVSSSSVYGQQEGEWVDETSPAVASSYSGRVMLEAEQVALKSGIPSSIVRLTGIYGPGREWLLTQVRRGYRVVTDPPPAGTPSILRRRRRGYGWHTTADRLPRDTPVAPVSAAIRGPDHKYRSNARCWTGYRF